MLPLGLPFYATIVGRVAAHTARRRARATRWRVGKRLGFIR